MFRAPWCVRVRGMARRGPRGVRELFVYTVEGLGLAAATRPTPRTGETTSRSSPELRDVASFLLPGRANPSFEARCLLRLYSLFFIYDPQEMVIKYTFLGGETPVILRALLQVFIVETDTSALHN